MKTIIFLLVYSILQPSITDNHCNSFKTGSFKIIDEKIGNEYIIERSETFQIEKDLKNNTVSKFKVTWVSDCEYELNVLEGREDVINFFKDKTLVIRILETFDNSYKFEARLKGTDFTLNQTAKRMD